MLKENKLKENTIVTFRLGTGDEIVGTFISNENGELLIKRPYITSITNDGEQLKVTFSPISYISEETVYPFNANTLMVLPTKLTNEPLESKYLSLVTEA